MVLATATVFPLAAQQTETDQKPIQELKTQAEAGDADAQFLLALRYADVLRSYREELLSTGEFRER